MRSKSHNAVTYQKAVHEELKNLEECSTDYVAETHIRTYSEMAAKELEPVPHEIVVGECLPTDITTCDVEEWAPTNTLLRPKSIHQTASLDRLALAEKTGHQELCIDAADTIGAENSLEKMLAHQMAVCHAEGMKLVAKAGSAQDEIIAQKMLSTAARFMGVFQKGFEAIYRTKRGNRQTVVVKHQQVYVADGGKALIADVDTRGEGTQQRRRGNAKK
jgi:hypothetical protein